YNSKLRFQSTFRLRLVLLRSVGAENPRLVRERRAELRFGLLPDFSIAARRAALALPNQVRARGDFVVTRFWNRFWVCHLFRCFRLGGNYSDAGPGVQSPDIAVALHNPTPKVLDSRELLWSTRTYDFRGHLQSGRHLFLAEWNPRTPRGNVGHRLAVRLRSTSAG